MPNLQSPVEAATTSYSLAELSANTGVSARTIRYYQSEQVLDAPAKAGRDAVYRQAHADRLALIGELRDRGLTLQTIRQLVAADNLAQSVSEWLGVDATLSAPWSDDRPHTFTADEMDGRLTLHGVNKPGVLAELQRAGFATAGHGNTWNVASPALLGHALDLLAAGIDLDISARVRDLLRRRLAKAVDDTVSLLVERAGRGFAGGATAGEISTAIAALRPTAREMSSVILAQEVERALATLIEAGPAPLVRARRR